MADLQHIASLILKEKCQLITYEESFELEEWRTDNPTNAELYEKFKDYDFLNSYGAYNDISHSQALSKYKAKYGFRRRFPLMKWGISAAASILILFAGYYVFNQPDDSSVHADIIAGSAKALLVLSNGEKVDLGNSVDTEKIMDGNSVIEKNKHTLNYQTQDKVAKTNIFHELIIPIGGEYKIELSDGTIVWMNSMSKLRFPVAFDSTHRDVFLDGEAYFEVAKDSRRPFHVILNNGLKVTVLGTSFNVRAYKDEKRVETVLEEGSVMINTDGNDVILQPNQRASYNNLSKNIIVDEVDTRNYTSWRSGHFVFNKMSIEQILNDISKWYSFEVDYKNEEVKNLIFCGSLKKHEDLNKFLTAIELAGGVKFEISGNKLIVY